MRRWRIIDMTHDPGIDCSRDTNALFSTCNPCSNYTILVLGRGTTGCSRVSIGQGNKSRRSTLCLMATYTRVTNTLKNDSVTTTFDTTDVQTFVKNMLLNVITLDSSVEVKPHVLADFNHSGLSINDNDETDVLKTTICKSRPNHIAFDWSTTRYVNDMTLMIQRVLQACILSKEQQCYDDDENHITTFEFECEPASIVSEIWLSTMANHTCLIPSSTSVFSNVMDMIGKKNSNPLTRLTDNRDHVGTMKHSMVKPIIIPAERWPNSQFNTNTLRTNHMWVELLKETIRRVKEICDSITETIRNGYSLDIVLNLDVSLCVNDTLFTADEMICIMEEWIYTSCKYNMKNIRHMVRLWSEDNIDIIQQLNQEIKQKVESNDIKTRIQQHISETFECWSFYVNMRDTMNGPIRSWVTLVLTRNHP